MDYLILGAILFFAFLAYAPDSLPKVALMLAWGFGLAAALYQVARWLF